MDIRTSFSAQIDQMLSDVDPGILAYNEDEFFLYSYAYEYLEFYANQNKLTNMAIALRLSRGLHDGKYRKSTITKDGVKYKLPYIIHPLLVTRMLADLHLPISKEDEDIVLASALCHDMIEDIEFESNGKELYEKYHLDQTIYNSVKKVSKRYDFTESEEKDFFHAIESDWITLLVKLADRSNNVEDLYNMSFWKVHEYVDETNKFFLPMIEYGIKNYPHLFTQIAILRDKILTLTEVSLTFVERYDERLNKRIKEVEALRKENEELRNEWKELWSK